jgi:hypothetical protein
VPAHLVRKRVLRTGDGSHPTYKGVEILENKNSLNNNNVVSNGNGLIKIMQTQQQKSYNAGYEEVRDTEHFWGFGK